MQGKERNNFSKHGQSRPDFGPNQVKKVSELKKGKQYIRVTGGFERKFTMIMGPFSVPRRRKLAPGDWIEIIDYPDGNSQLISLQDHSVTPYVNGRWNTTNCIKFS